MSKFIISLIFSLFLSVHYISAGSMDATLKNAEGWTTDTIAPGYIWYQFEGYYRVQSAHQIVNVIEIDLLNPDYKVEVSYVPSRDSLSNVARKSGAIAGINGTYELDASFIKSLNSVHSQVILDPDHLRYWKHEGALSFDGAGQNASIQFGTNQSYLTSSYQNIISGAPMLVSDYDPVGETFIGDVTGINLNALDYEDYRRHQGVRHPRTAVALTENNKMLLITVDGRRTDVSNGMTAEELTEFIVKYFNPVDALNIDGGGSTAMWIKDRDVSATGIVNYPTDNSRFDHWGQRRVTSFILIKPTFSDEDFAGGSGTINDPYIITSASHMQLMRSADYSNPLFFRLEADVDLAGIDWAPINSVDPFNKQIHFDGNGHVIKNLTSKGYSYASLFGVLLGSCKNLGVVNAEVESTNGGGIIAGYVGLRAFDSPVGVIENCFTSGLISGPDAIGGIAGHIGRSYSGAPSSGIRNCYSTATITATATSGNSRAGGIVGINWTGGFVENSYATGTVTSRNAGAGGIAGWIDSSISGCVALNEAIYNLNPGNIGRISAFNGAVDGVIAQGINCWGLEGMFIDNGGMVLQEEDLNTTEVTVARESFDGLSKSAAFLRDPLNYFNELDWDFASDENVWAQTMNHGFPIFQWLYNREDFEQISGHLPTSVRDISKSNKLHVYTQNRRVFLTSEKPMKHVSVYNISGKLAYSFAVNGSETSFDIDKAGFYLLSILLENTRQSYKLVIK